jgi:hypothetical protein
MHNPEMLYKDQSFETFSDSVTQIKELKTTTCDRATYKYAPLFHAN